MVQSFDPRGNFIAIEVDLSGPSASYLATFALDTGSNQTGVSIDLLRLLGVDMTQPYRDVKVLTANGEVIVSEFVLDSLKAFGIDVSPIHVLAVDLPSVGYQGLLGTDFLDGSVLTVDFRQGIVIVN